MKFGFVMSGATGGIQAAGGDPQLAVTGHLGGLGGVDPARLSPAERVPLIHRHPIRGSTRSKRLCAWASPLRAISGGSTAPKAIPTAEAAPRPDAQASAPLPTRPTWTNGLVGTATRICHEGPVPAPASQSAATRTFDRPPTPSFTITLQVRPKRLLCALPKQRQASTLPRFLSRTQPSMLPRGLSPTQSTL